MLHPKGGGIASGSVKQKLNTRSSTTAELIVCDDFLTKLLWTQNFMTGQGICFQENQLFQDNKNSILLAKNGRSALGKRTRSMNVHYFAIKDCVDRGKLKIFHLEKNSMLGDFFTKPLQGSKFKIFWNLILGRDPVDSYVGIQYYPKGRPGAHQELAKDMQISWKNYHNSVGKPY